MNFIRIKLVLRIHYSRYMIIYIYTTFVVSFIDATDMVDDDLCATSLVMYINHLLYILFLIYPYRRCRALLAIHYILYYIRPLLTSISIICTFVDPSWLIHHQVWMVRWNMHPSRLPVSPPPKMCTYSIWYDRPFLKKIQNLSSH